MKYRANIRLAQSADLARAKCTPAGLPHQNLKGAIASVDGTIRVVDLFAGAGGLSVGFVAASDTQRRFRLLYAAEGNEIYNSSLNANHKYLVKALHGTEGDAFDPIDLLTKKGRDVVSKAVERAKGVDLLIGGPPCQGFSQSNRNSWSPENPHNHLVEVFLRFALEHRPKAVLMENVQGIMWTPQASARKHDRLPVVEYISGELENAGYTTFTAVLDAAWYGVPQHRNRFFLIALRDDLGYSKNDFGPWGPFPLPTHGPGAKLPYVTVRDAIADLPEVSNGESRWIQEYKTPRLTPAVNAFLQEVRGLRKADFIEGHVVTKQADYVLRRYAKVPPGGNWRNIRKMLTTYTKIENTHSNIYRRLIWDEPSVTIGHYRKSMLIHPSQHRGLSLREAARLQSFPDWFTFHGNSTGKRDSLAQKQQQLANAVSYLMTRSVASYLLNF